MGKPSQCSQCGKQANIHLTQIVKGKAIKVHMCESCAQAKSLTGGLEAQTLAHILGLVQESEKQTKDAFATGGNMNPFMPAMDGGETEDTSSAHVVDACGATFEDFKKSGRLSCATAYQAFEEQLKPILENMHRGLKHAGKRPTFGAAAKRIQTQRTQRLRAELARAIQGERYEEAARLRDDLNSLKEGV